MTNRNPERPLNIDQIMEMTFNPLYKTDLEKYKETQEQILKEVFKE